MRITMNGVREYGDGLPVELEWRNGRPVVVAFNEAGCCATYVDLLDLMEWYKYNPTVFEPHGNEEINGSLKLAGAPQGS